MTDALINFLNDGGYLAIFIMMMVENIFPPIPSEVILPYVGHMAATSGEVSLWLAILVASVGSLLGTSAWFLLGWILSVEKLHNFFKRFGGYIAITVKDFEKGSNFFKRHERATVFFGRMIPTVRSVISIPAGSVRMNVLQFATISFTGILLWNTLLIGAGYFFLSDIHLVNKFVKPISDIVILFFILAYCFQVVRFLRNKGK